MSAGDGNETSIAFASDRPPRWPLLQPPGVHSGSLWVRRRTRPRATANEHRTSTMTGHVVSERAMRLLALARRRAAIAAVCTSSRASTTDRSLGALPRALAIAARPRLHPALVAAGSATRAFEYVIAGFRRHRGTLAFRPRRVRARATRARPARAAALRSPARASPAPRSTPPPSRAAAGESVAREAPPTTSTRTETTRTSVTFPRASSAR